MNNVASPDTAEVGTQHHASITVYHTFFLPALHQRLWGKQLNNRQCPATLLYCSLTYQICLFPKKPARFHQQNKSELVTVMRIMWTEHYFQWMSIIYLWWKPSANHLKGKKERQKRLTQVSTLTGIEERHIYPSVTLSRWKSFQDKMSSPSKLRRKVGC